MRVRLGCNAKGLVHKYLCFLSRAPRVNRPVRAHDSRTPDSAIAFEDLKNAAPFVAAPPLCVCSLGWVKRYSRAAFGARRKSHKIARPSKPVAKRVYPDL